MLAMAPHMSPTPVAEIARHRVGFSCGSKEAYGRVVLVYEARLLDVFAVAAEHLAEHIAPVAVNAGSFSGFLFDRARPRACPTPRLLQSHADRATGCAAWRERRGSAG